MIDVTLFTRPRCHLCDVMKEALGRAASGLDVRISETNVGTDSELERRYGNDVPVLLVNGVKAFEHRATEEELRRRLERG